MLFRINKIKIVSFFVFVLAFIVQDAAATHIVGGEMNYRYLGSNNYEIRLTVYRDCYNGVPPFDDPAAVGIYNSSGVLVDSLLMAFIDLDTIPLEINTPCFIPPTDVCYETTTYIDTINLPAISGGYTIVYQRCCRNNTIINIETPGDMGGTYLATIPDPGVASGNSNPVFTSLPPPFICLDAPFTFNHSAIDYDGDSLVYELYTPLHGGSTITPVPRPPAPPPYDSVTWASSYSLANVFGGTPLTINRNTGAITATPNTIGQFVYGIRVKEYRNGVLLSITSRDFQANVVDCPNLTVSSAQAPFVNCGDNTVQFTNNSVGALSYYWDFGDPAVTTDNSTETSPSYTYSGPGTYQVMLIAVSSGDSTCQDTSFTEVNIYPDFIVDFSHSSDTCESFVPFTDESVPISTINWWQWSFGDGDSSAIQNPDHFYTNVGYYTVKLFAESAEGCIDSSVQTVYIPFLSSYKDTTNMCVSDSVLLSTEGAVTYEWTENGVPPVLSTDSFIWVSPLTTTQYYVERQRGICNNTDIFTVTIGPPDTVDAGEDTVVCEGSSVTLTATGGANHVWSPGAALSCTDCQSTIASPATSTWYYVDIRDSSGFCGNYDSVFVQVKPKPNPRVFSPAFCLGDTAALDAGPGYDSYSWSTGDTTQFIMISDGGMYTVQVEMDGCWGDIDTIFAGPVDLLIDVIPDTSVKLYESVGLYASGGTSYTWTPSTGLNCTDCPDPDASPEYDQTYLVTIYDSATGCSKTDTVFVKVDLPLNIFVPQVFTPNGDFQNEMLFVRTTGISKIDFVVYDRWGELVFRSNDLNKGWDGTFKGKPVNAGVYVWHLIVTEEYGYKTHKFSGNVTLIR